MIRFVPVLLLSVLAWSAPPPPPPSRAVMRIPFWSPDNTAVPRDDLQVKLNGKPAKVSRYIGAKDDLLILLVLDWSGDLSLIDPAREALIAAIQKLPPNAQVGLLRVQDGLRVLLDPGTDRTQLADVLRGITVTARPGLLDAIEPVQRLGDDIAAKAHVRVAALYVSDSDITAYREDYTNPVVNSSDSHDMSRRFPEGLIQEKIRQLKSTVLGGETPIFLVHLDYRSDRLNTAYQTGLLELALASGGAAEFCRSLAEIPVSIEKVMGNLLSHQSVEVEWQPGKAKQVDVAIEAQGRTLRFRPRRQLGVRKR
ncbi:MAG: hypothetical protein IT165_29740 [Bryobacterales bacterium]|nr:hypothetical protein [Bryobacterales bacterium]